MKNCLEKLEKLFFNFIKCLMYWNYPDITKNKTIYQSKDFFIRIYDSSAIIENLKHWNKCALTGVLTQIWWYNCHWDAAWQSKRMKCQCRVSSHLRKQKNNVKNGDSLCDFICIKFWEMPINQQWAKTLWGRGNKW